MPRKTVEHLSIRVPKTYLRQFESYLKLEEAFKGAEAIFDLSIYDSALSIDTGELHHIEHIGEDIAAELLLRYCNLHVAAQKEANLKFNIVAVTEEDEDDGEDERYFYCAIFLDNLVKSGPLPQEIINNLTVYTYD